MPEVTTVGRLMMSEALPEGRKDIGQPFDKKSLNAVLEDAAKADPDGFPALLRGVERVTLLAASSYGRNASPGLTDLEPPAEVARIREEIRGRVRAIIQNPNIGAKEKGPAIIKMMLPEMAKVQAAIRNTGMDKNVFVDQALVGARGNESQAMQLLFGDMVVVDNKDRPVPIPGLHGYGEGVTPSEFWAGAYGARKGLIDLQLATPKAGYFCLHGDTLVRMADLSVRKISDIKTGDMVMGADKTGKAFPVKVTAKFYNGLLPVSEFVFRRGAGRSDFISIVGTEEHKVLASIKRGKVSKPLDVRPLKEARKNFSLKPAFGFEVEGGVKFDLAFFIGALIGDGCTSGRNATFSCADEVLLDFLRPMLERNGLTLTRIIRPEYKAPDIEFYVGCGGPSGYISDGRSIKKIPSVFTELLKELGMRGKRSWEKTIPAAVAGWDKASVAEFLGGLWSTDGCATHSNLSTLPVLRLGMTSESVVRGVKELLEVFFGIYSTPVIKQTSGIGKTNKANKYDLEITGRRPVYHLTISNQCSILRFLKEIPLRGIKLAHLKMLMGSFTGSKRDMSYSFAFHSKIDRGCAAVFDIEVDCQDHLFVLANGAVVSNSKKLRQAAHRVVVTEEDCGADGVGLEVDGSAPDNKGAVLALPAGGMPAGHLLTGSDLSKLEGKRVVVRSTITCRSPDGVCAKCAGHRESGDFAQIGDHIGLTASAAIAEPLTQAVISSKHTGGVAGVDDRKTTGFKAVNQLAEVPAASPDWAPLAPIDGSVASIDKAAHGGSYVLIGDKRIYVPAGSGLKVKPGDHVEAGDALADGIPSPKQVAELKGLGEARQYFTKVFGDTLAANGAGNHRRNVEALAKAFLSRVEITGLDGVAGYLPGDIVPHSALTADWEPRKGTAPTQARQAVGMYLEAPYLHYLVGDRVSKSAAAKMEAAGFKTILAHRDPPPFKPTVSSVADVGTDDPDYETRLGGFNLKASFLDAAQRGSTTDPTGTSYIPKIVSGRI